MIRTLPVDWRTTSDENLQYQAEACCYHEPRSAVRVAAYPLTGSVDGGVPCPTMQDSRYNLG